MFDSHNNSLTSYFTEEGSEIPKMPPLAQLTGKSGAEIQAQSSQAQAQREVVCSMEVLPDQASSLATV